MNVLSLFDGISCGRVALERAGFTHIAYNAYEIDKYAIQVSKKNYPDVLQCGDVYSTDFSFYNGYIDLLIGGSPCTYWSIAKRGREVTSSGIGFDLFMQYVKALRNAKPKYFLYENNASIHKDIKSAITKELGIEPIEINSALVSAQNRKRLYWTNIPNVTQPDDKGIILNDILDNAIGWTDKAYCLTSSYNGTVLWNTLERKQRTMVASKLNQVAYFGKNRQSERIYSVFGKSVCIRANAGGQGSKTGLYYIDLPDGNYFIRKLTPIECERLQTLPDNYTEGISNTQRYKCIGNGWTVDVIAHILSFIPKGVI